MVRKRAARRAVTLMELVVSFGVFGILLGLTAALFGEILGVWRDASGKDTAEREMRKARAALQADVALASPGQLGRAFVPPSLGGGGDDGEALWFLSPVDPVSEQAVHKQDGSPFWQRNVLYYLVVPNNHSATFRTACAGGVGPNGYDDRCPHKVLIRKVIDTGPATVPADETTEEALIVNIGPYLTRPDGFSTAGMAAEPGLEEVEIVASHLLTFTSSTPASPPNEVAVDLRAVSIEVAQRKLRLGTDSAYTGPFTRQAPFSVFLNN